ncbi:LOW QUALITY PROTEIN: sodium-coupled monocarboxylate transporter 1-like [Glossina fuscipes]|uniref:LOW QUALITY PROTEIN: sodium-coupled monocarboxylate transporter 1-like n=1 Tax=Glossina fuscipes TaxID=7396 RepID=A0A8U0WA19_9MUSC|nr:LOW QUALITY PROTEIN: sodium-coupled monocarboxylate transporter 1-like [Glossina fuscipes]
MVVGIAIMFDMMDDLVNFSSFRFHWADYVVCIALVLLSTGTGFYIAKFYKIKLLYKLQFYRGKERVSDVEQIDYGSTKMNEYLLGSRTLSVLPVAMSLVGSYVSGVTILGTVSEIYYYGTQYSLIAVAIIAMAFPVAYIYVPVFYVLGVHSSYEYLGMRFNNAVRTLCSVFFILDEIFFLPMVVHVPSITFQQVTGVHALIVSTIMCALCVAYTLVGGIKAVVYTDAWQVFVMFWTVITVVIIGIVYGGGFGPIGEAASEGGRLIFANVNPSLLERQTLWAVLIGGFSYWTSFNSVNQTMVQRYLSLSSLKKARLSILVFTASIVFFIIFLCIGGLLVYQAYAHCDPLSAKLIEQDDQIFPIYVIQTVGNLPGMPGLFVAGVFGAALSSLSTVLNSTALVIMEDIVKNVIKIELSPKTANRLVKGSVLILGLVGLALSFLFQHLEGILSVATSLTGLASSAQFGMFTLGMLFPWTNSIGALTGGIIGYLMGGWIVFGIQIASYMDLLVRDKLPLSVSECPFNATLMEPQEQTDINPVFLMSYHWTNPIGVGTTLLVGAIVSLATKPTKLEEINMDYLAPFTHRFFRKFMAKPQDNTEPVT